MQGCCIDTWGVGTRLITSEDNPALGGVYKMAAEVVDGRMVPKIKLSDNPAKVTNPGYKKVFRLYDLKGMAIADLIALDEETIDTSKPLRIFDPEHPYKNMLLKRFNARELLVPVFRAGRQVYASPSVMEIQRTQRPSWRPCGTSTADSCSRTFTRWTCPTGCMISKSA